MKEGIIRSTSISIIALLLLISGILTSYATATGANDLAATSLSRSGPGISGMKPNGGARYSGGGPLWNNGPPDGVNGVSCVNWPSYPLDRYVVDDFYVPPIGWFVEGGHFRIVTYSGLGPGSVDGVKVFFFEDVGGQPDVNIYWSGSCTFLPSLTGDQYFGRPEIAVECRFGPVSLAPGKWWVCFQPEMDDNCFWLTALGYGQSIWVDYPDAGYPRWTDGFSVFGDYYDVSFLLRGIEKHVAKRSGNVNTGLGNPANVLFINGSTGDKNRVYEVSFADYIYITMLTPPAGPNPASYSLYFILREAGPFDVTNQPYGIGQSCFPTPLNGAGPPDVYTLGNNLGYNSLLGYPWILTVPAPTVVAAFPAWMLAPITFTFQGFIMDNGSSGPGLSITNAIILRIY